jgi:hypothetical protein
MIVEFPAFACTAGAPAALCRRMTAARAAFVRACGQPPATLAGTATITGVVLLAAAERAAAGRVTPDLVPYLAEVRYIPALFSADVLPNDLPSLAAWVLDWAVRLPPTVTTRTCELCRIPWVAEATDES